MCFGRLPIESRARLVRENAIRVHVARTRDKVRRRRRPPPADNTSFDFTRFVTRTLNGAIPNVPSDAATAGGVDWEGEGEGKLPLSRNVLKG